MTETSYTAIRTGIAEYLVDNLDWLDALDTDAFDYRPDDIVVVFGALPAVVVDFDPRATNEWAQVDQGYFEGVPFMVEIFTEIETDDTTHGRNASQDIATKLREVENLFRSNPTVGGLVKGSNLRSSKVELLEMAAVKLAGVTARWAWLTLVVFVVR